MKRMMTLVLAAALCLLVHPAMANSWGLSGALLSAVASTDDWNDYHAIGGQVGDAAVLHSRYHNVLAIVLEGELALFPTAVYQPQDGRDSSLRLSGSGESLTISYGDEQYVFEKEGTAYRLQSAVIGDFRLVLSWNQYLASEGSQSAILQQDVTLDGFNIRLFPRSVEQVRHLNLMRAALDSGENILGWHENGRGSCLNSIGQGTVAVYSAPYGESAWRAAEGKAAVALSGEVWLLRLVTNADGDCYACVRYDVSERTQRIGYVPASALRIRLDTTPSDDLIDVIVRANCDTYLTDDPDVSQFAQFEVPAGTLFSCLGVYDDAYAYVSAEVKEGRFTDGGAIVWGFVPLRDLALEDGVAGEVRREIMASLAGTWCLEAGGNLAEDTLFLNADGTYQGTYWNSNQVNSGRWTVTDYTPARNLYWNDPPYEIAFYRDDGTVNIRGLDLSNGNLNLSYWEGGGGYVQMTGEGTL